MKKNEELIRIKGSSGRINRNRIIRIGLIRIGLIRIYQTL